jgi:hypothetical protein
LIAGFFQFVRLDNDPGGLSAVGVESFGRLKLAIGGAFAIFAGDKILRGMRDLVEKTADLSHELAQIKKLGVSDADLSAATRRAIDVTRSVKGINERDALSIYGDIYSLVGAKDALKLMDPLAKYDVVAGNTSGDFSGALHGNRNLVRAGRLPSRTRPTFNKTSPTSVRPFITSCTRWAAL